MKKQLKLRRVVITGIGLLTPLGNSTEESWNGVINGNSGAATLSSDIDHSGFSVHFGCQIKDFDPCNWLDPRTSRRVDRFTQYAVAASKMAFNDSALDTAALNPERCGTVFASGIGGILSVEEQLRKYLQNYADGSGERPRKAAKKISPFSVPLLMVNAASGQIAIELGLRGINYAPVSACSSGAHAAGLAFRHVQTGEADIMLAGGSEAGIGIMGLGGFSSMKALSRRNEAPERASRPFDRERDGFVQGEGAGAVVLEELEHALNRGARIYAEVLGYGFTDDARHITTPCPDGSGLARAMTAALAMGEVPPAAVDYINAHGTSTELNDLAETAAIHGALGAAARRVAVSSTKSCTGHMLGAAGGVEVGFTALALQNGLIPPTINYENPDPGCDLDYTPNHAVKRDLNYALTNSCGFGGHNVSILLGHYPER